MKVEFTKKMKIASDLLSYCHMKGATDFHFDIVTESGASVFMLKASPVSLSKEDMDSLNQKLSMPRQREIEQNYWALGGESEITELMLVGAMSDEATAECANHVLTIKIKRRP